MKSRQELEELSYIKPIVGSRDAKKQIEKLIRQRKQKIRNYYGDCDCSSVDELRKEIKNLKRYLKYINNQKFIDSATSISQEEYSLTPEQSIIFSKIVSSNSNLNDFSVDDLVSITRYIIVNCDVNTYKELIIRVIQHLSYQLNDDQDYSNKIITALKKIKSSIRFKNSISDDSKQRIVLNTIKKLIVVNIKMYKPKKKEHNHLINIINYWLDDDSNELFLYKLFRRISNTINIRDQSGTHILVIILKRYIESYKEFLKNQNNSIVDKDYYKRLFIFLHGFDSLLLTDSDISEMESIIDDFKLLLERKKYKAERKLEALHDIEDIFKCKTESCEQFYQNDDEISEQIALLPYRISLELKSKSRINLTDEYTIVINDVKTLYNNYAYSCIEGENGSLILKVHVIDINSLIGNTALEDMMKSRMFSDIEHDQYLLPLFAIQNILSMIPNRDIPTITYEVSISEKGKCSNLRIYKSKVRVNDIFTSDQISSSNIPIELSNFIKLKKILGTDISDKLDVNINRCIRRRVGRDFCDKKIPFIFKRQDRQDEKKYVHDMTFLNSILSKLNDEMATIIYSIICEDINCSYYSAIPGEHIGVNENYYSDILIPLDSYVGVVLQKIIEKFYLKNNGYNEISEVDIRDIILRSNTTCHDKSGDKVLCMKMN